MPLLTTYSLKTYHLLPKPLPLTPLKLTTYSLKTYFLLPKMISKIQLIGNKQVTLFVKLNR